MSIKEDVRNTRAFVGATLVTGLPDTGRLKSPPHYLALPGGT
jgi:hypothetical protein